MAALLCGCAQTPRQSVTSPTLTFLTRHGCVNTDTMRARFDEALRALGRPATYQVIDVDTLPDSDPRGGYGTPTVLVGNRDLFGMPEPPTPHAGPT